jgi:hypothetical protein
LASAKVARLGDQAQALRVTGFIHEAEMAFVVFQVDVPTSGSAIAQRPDHGQ